MHMQREQQNPHSIQAYSDTQVMIKNIVYSHSIVVGQDFLLSPWTTHSMEALLVDDLWVLITQKPELIVLGSSRQSTQCPMPIRQQFIEAKIGLECMTLGAACRTFNLLLHEQRSVLLGIIF